MAARVATQSAIERFGGGAVFGVKLVVTSPAFSASGAAYPPTIPRERETEPDHPDPEDEIQEVVGSVHGHEVCRCKNNTR